MKESIEEIGFFASEDWQVKKPNVFCKDISSKKNMFWHSSHFFKKSIEKSIPRYKLGKGSVLMRKIPVGTCGLWLLGALVFLACAVLPAQAEALHYAAPVKGDMALLPYLEYSLRSPASGEAEFAPFKDMPFVVPPGAVWGRILLIPEKGSVVEDMVISMGNGAPGQPMVWAAPLGQDEQPLSLATPSGLFQEIPHTAAGYVLPAALFKTDSGDLRGIEIRLRMDGVPSLWFSPVLFSSQKQLSTASQSARPFLLVSLAVLGLLALVRGLGTREEGRLWVTLFCVSAFIQAFWAMPVTPQGGVQIMGIPSVLCAGLSLMLLPYVARTVLFVRERSRFWGIALLGAALPGALLALWPLLPGQAWLVRFLDVWPLGAVLTFIPVFALFLRGVYGSGFFVLACLSLVLGSLLGIMPPLLWYSNALESMTIAGPLFAAFSQPLSFTSWSLAPLFGLTFGVLFLVAAPSAVLYAEPVEEKEDPTIPNLSGMGINCGFMRKERSGGTLGHTPIQLSPLDQIVPLGANTGIASPAPEHTQITHMANAALQEHLSKLELAIRKPMDALLRGAVELDQLLAAAAERKDLTALPQVRQQADTIVASGREMMDIITRMPGSLRRPRKKKAHEKGTGHVAFDLPKLLNSVAASIMEEAEAKNVAFSWFVSPHLSVRYYGDFEQLKELLLLLLRDSLRASAKGDVISVRFMRDPESREPSRLLCVVADTGQGAPPHSRDGLGLLKAWELASSHSGFVRMETGQRGLVFNIGMRLVPLTATQETPEEQKNAALEAEKRASTCLVVSPKARDRHLLVYYLQGMAELERIFEASNAREALEVYATATPPLVVLDPNLSEDEYIQTIAQVRAFEGDNACPATSFLGLCKDEKTAAALMRAGCDETLPWPHARAALYAVLGPLLDASRARPWPSARRLPETEYVAGSPEPVLEEAARKPERLAVQVVPVVDTENARDIGDLEIVLGPNLRPLSATAQKTTVKSEPRPDLILTLDLKGAEERKTTALLEHAAEATLQATMPPLATELVEVTEITGAEKEEETVFDLTPAHMARPNSTPLSAVTLSMEKEHEPTAEPVKAAVVEASIPEPIVELVTEPVIDAPKPIAEAILEAIPEQVLEPVAEAVPEPIEKPVAKPVEKSMEEAMAEVVAALLAEQKPKHAPRASKPASQSATKAAANPQEEAALQPTDEQSTSPAILETIHLEAPNTPGTSPFVPSEKKKGIFSRLFSFKPTPQVQISDTKAEELLGSEWVGEPEPLRIEIEPMSQEHADSIAEKPTVQVQNMRFVLTDKSEIPPEPDPTLAPKLEPEEEREQDAELKTEQPATSVQKIPPVKSKKASAPKWDLTALEDLANAAFTEAPLPSHPNIRILPVQQYPENTPPDATEQEPKKAKSIQAPPTSLSAMVDTAMLEPEPNTSSARMEHLSLLDFPAPQSAEKGRRKKGGLPTANGVSIGSYLSLDCEYSSGTAGRRPQDSAYDADNANTDVADIMELTEADMLYANPEAARNTADTMAEEAEDMAPPFADIHALFTQMRTEWETGSPQFAETTQSLAMEAGEYGLYRLVDLCCGLAEVAGQGEEDAVLQLMLDAEEEVSRLV